MTALYETTVFHRRQSPLRHEFTYRSYWWLVDLDDPPVLPRGLRWLAGFRREDHVDVRPLVGDRARVLTLTSARVAGHVFNPLSVHYALGEDGTVETVVAEVHNTYGGRHAYVLSPDADDRATVDKVFYVSPFHEVDGSYAMRLPLPGDDLVVDLTYTRPDSKPFVATVRGTRVPFTVRNLLLMFVKHPLVTRAVALRIRVQGIRLFTRRLPVVPRLPVDTVSARPDPAKELAS